MLQWKKKKKEVKGTSVLAAERHWWGQTLRFSWNIYIFRLLLLKLHHIEMRYNFWLWKGKKRNQINANTERKKEFEVFYLNHKLTLPLRQFEACCRAAWGVLSAPYLTRQFCHQRIITQDAGNKIGITFHFLGSVQHWHWWRHTVGAATENKAVWQTSGWFRCDNHTSGQSAQICACRLPVQKRTGLQMD